MNDFERFKVMINRKRRAYAVRKLVHKRISKPKNVKGGKKGGGKPQVVAKKGSKSKNK